MKRTLFLVLIFSFPVSLQAWRVPHDANRKPGAVVVDQEGDFLDIKDGKIDVSGSSITSTVNWESANRNVWVTSGTISVDNIPSLQEVKEERVSDMLTVGIDVSSMTYYTINSRTGRKSILIQCRTGNSGNVYMRESNSGIESNGIELTPGQSWSSINYTGILYLLTESGKPQQKVVISEEYKP